MEENENVVNFPGITRLDIPAERALNGALKNELTGVVVIGWDKNDEFYFASSIADGGSVLWLLEGAKKYLLEIGFPND